MADEAADIIGRFDVEINGNVDGRADGGDLRQSQVRRNVDRAGAQVFEDTGAYTLVKAHMFNGINLPSVHILMNNGELRRLKDFDYRDYLSRCGEEDHVGV